VLASLEPRRRRGEISAAALVVLERHYRWEIFARAFRTRLDYVVEER
jgi:hypothetical protein